MDLVFAPSQFESWPIERLRPSARNAKIHGTDQVAKIAASMAKFGWTVPCLVADDGELIAGHGRVLAAIMLGLKDVPVIRLVHLDEAERRAYRIADNKLTELGEWDEAMLRDEIAGLLAEDFDLSLLGIAEEDLDALLRDPDQVEGGAVEGEDDIPEPPVTPVSIAGELWQLGSHRLICGTIVRPSELRQRRSLKAVATAVELSLSMTRIANGKRLCKSRWKREILRGSSILNVNIWTQHITLVSMQKRSIQTRCCPEKVIGLGI